MTATHTPNKRLRMSVLAGAAALVSAAAIQPASAAAFNFPPTATFTMDASPVAVGDNIVFNAAASRDIDGSIAKYEWDLNADGIFEVRSQSIRTANTRYATPGTVSVTLRVTDNRGATDTATKPVTVHQKPVALLTADRAVPNVGDVVGYRATGSYDPDAGGFIRAYYWDRDGNGTFEFPSGTNPYITTSFPTAGQHRLAVRVYDRDFAFSDQALVVRVNKRPTAVVSATPNPAVVNQPVALSGAASTDDRSITKYEWDLNGDGTYETNTAASPTTSTMFTTLGQARVGLQVTDSDGATDQSVATITVNAAPARDTTAPRVIISPTRVKMIAGTATFTVTCPATELRCDTRFTLKGRFGTLKNKTLGTTQETIPGGEALEITVALSSKAKKAIRRDKVVFATAIATATDDAGNTGTTRKNVRIKR